MCMLGAPVYGRPRKATSWWMSCVAGVRSRVGIGSDASGVGLKDSIALQSTTLGFIVFQWVLNLHRRVPVRYHDYQISWLLITTRQSKHSRPKHVAGDMGQLP